MAWAERGRNHMSAAGGFGWGVRMVWRGEGYERESKTQE